MSNYKEIFWDYFRYLDEIMQIEELARKYFILQKEIDARKTSRKTIE